MAGPAIRFFYRIKQNRKEVYACAYASSIAWFHGMPRKKKRLLREKQGVKRKPETSAEHTVYHTVKAFATPLERAVGAQGRRNASQCVSWLRTKR